MTETLDRVDMGLRSIGPHQRSDLSDVRVLIVHDWLAAWAGAERCVEQMLEVLPSADVVVGLMARPMPDLNETTRRAKETWLARFPDVRRPHR